MDQTLGTEGRAVQISYPEVANLAGVAYHHGIPELSRYIFPGIEAIAAVHQISAAEHMDRHYCEPHSHDNSDEIVIALGTTEDLRFRIDTSEGSSEVGPMAAVRFPAGSVHAINVVSGSGFLVVLRAAAAS